VIFLRSYSFLICLFLFSNFSGAQSSGVNTYSLSFDSSDVYNELNRYVFNTAAGTPGNIRVSAVHYSACESLSFPVAIIPGDCPARQRTFLTSRVDW
jgi:hypothetical protein